MEPLARRRPNSSQRDTLKESDSVAAMFRALLVTMSLVAPALVLDHPDPDRWFYLLGGFASVYALVTLLMAWRGVRGEWHRPITLVIDNLLLTALVYYGGGGAGGGLYSGLFPLYYLTVITGAIWFNLTGAVASAAMATVFYAAVLTATEWTTPGSVLFTDLRELVMPHGLLLFLAAILCAYLAEAWRTERSAADQQRAIVAEFKQQMDMAQELQLLVQPAVLPRVEGIDIGVRTRQAAVVVGGDYYDAVTFSDGALAVCVADVSGKSVPGQLRLPLVKYAFRICASHYRQPDRVMAQLGRLLYDELPPEMFVSMVYVLIEPERSSLRLTRAGHPAPLHLTAKTASVAEVSPRGVVLGV
ncbi:MAG: serine/threonine-protein phosphatase [Armatimonadetes bacterium]|nr:serine/threonine-protein phosphatase [Armatimonadota bacterium]